MNCATCEKKDCYSGKDCYDLANETKKRYTEENLDSIKVSASIEAEHYMKETRLEELILYAKKMNYKRLGLAFCLGLEKEAKIVNEILEKHFEMHSVCCKIGGIDKKSLDLERLHDYEGVEAMCNPIGQAYVLNRENCDLNIILGLCMGHDTLFTKYSKAPVTTLAVKDRVLAHNPLGAIYSGYYLRKRFKED